MPNSEKMNRIIVTCGSAVDIAEQERKEGIDDLRQPFCKSSGAA